MVLMHADRRWMLASPLLGRAIVYSIVAHLLVLMLGNRMERLGLWHWKMVPPTARVPSQTAPMRELVIEVEPAAPARAEKRLTYVDVPPSQIAPAPPKEAEFYSAQNSLAANPDTSIDSNQPKIAGTQDKVPKTVDTPRVVSTPAVPEAVTEREKEPPTPKAIVTPTAAVPEVPAKPVAQPEVREVAEAPPPQGDLQVAKVMEKTPPQVRPVEVEVKPPPEPPKPTRTRPRRLAAVLPQELQSAIAGEKLRQAGGVKRFGMESSFDVKSTEFGAYDAAIIAAIQKRWYDLLEDRTVSRSQVGKVVLEFRLTVDGRITDMRESENQVTGILGLMCQRAVQDPQPYAPWPRDLRRVVGRDYREVRFVFHYN